MLAVLRQHTVLLIAFAIAFIWLLQFYTGYNIIIWSAVLIFSIAFLSSITGYNSLALLLVFALPFSINYAIPGTSADIRLPSELLIITVSAAYILRQLFIAPIDLLIWKHPVTRILVVLFFIQLITALTSTMFFVSIKSLIIKGLYMLVFYFVCLEIFKSNIKHIITFYMAYLVSLIATVLFVLNKHAEFNFSKNFAAIVTPPFYSDHTIYSACIVFFIPLIVLFAVKSKTIFNSRGIAILFLGIFILLLIAVFLSTSRAALLSIIVLLSCAAIIYFKIRTSHLVLLFFACFIYAGFHYDDIRNSIETNRSDSKKITADFETQAKSITNITSDNSNAERINRWKCALRMAIQKPFTGFGPGTFQFQYLSFQKPEDMTMISVTSPYNIRQGRGGTAHNELLLTLAESGISAFLAFIALIVLVINSASITLKSLRNKDHNHLLLAIYLGWISYVFHSMFNNFLDTDKAAFLFYSAMAAMVAIDLKFKEEQS